MIERSIVFDAAPMPSSAIELIRVADLTSWNLDNLAAPFWRLYVPLSPGGILRWNGRRQALAVGQMFAIGPGTDAATLCAQPFRKAYLHATASVGERMPGIWAFPITDALLTGLHAAVDQRHLAATALLMNGFWNVALGQVLARQQPQPAPSATVADIIAYLRANLDDPPSHTTLATLSGLHPHSLTRRFVQEVGIPPQRLGLRLRLDEAARLLSEGRITIDTIAARCGFGDRNHLTKAFTRQWGCAPALYRQRHGP